MWHMHVLAACLNRFVALPNNNSCNELLCNCSLFEAALPITGAICYIPSQSLGTVVVAKQLNASRILGICSKTKHWEFNGCHK